MDEPYERLREPVQVIGGLTHWVAVAGLIVNIAAFWVLSRADGENLNVRAAALHLAGDLLGSVAALVASLVIIYSGWTPIDPLLSILVALIILKSAWTVVRESGHILLEGAPRGFDRRKVAQAVEAGVCGVVHAHHVHACSITQERPMATLEVEISSSADPNQVKAAAKSILRKKFGIEHATFEVNWPSGEKTSKQMTG